MSFTSRARRVQREFAVDSYQNALKLVLKHDVDAKRHAKDKAMPLGDADMAVLAVAGVPKRP